MKNHEKRKHSKLRDINDFEASIEYVRTHHPEKSEVWESVAVPTLLKLAWWKTQKDIQDMQRISQNLGIDLDSTDLSELENFIRFKSEQFLK